MKLEARLDRLEGSRDFPVTAEIIFAEASNPTIFDAERIEAMSRRMPQDELEKAISELARMIEERDA